ncbi:MAG: hypothetical protein GF334_10255 [Candidatus Altiarchaeales archaeon]|nr:hypothetical protein [Candidatus Altiarchaeales archaeon]
MSELQQYFDNFRTWSHPDPEKCKCRGGGYALSEVDTWHPCPEHYVPGQPHPEDWDRDPDWDQEAERAKYEAQVKEDSKCPHDPTFICNDKPCEVCTKHPLNSGKGNWIEKESALEFCNGPEDEGEIPF